jgi:hypothetical protein
MPMSAQAATPILLESEGAAGGQFSLAGSGFDAGATYTVRLQQGRMLVGLDPVVTGRRGELGPIPVALPGSVAPGEYELQALNSLGGVAASADFTVRSPIAIQLSPGSSRPGATVAVALDNLVPGTLVLSVNDIAVIGPIAVRGSSYSGDFAVPIVPAGPATGTHRGDPAHG